VPWCPRVQIGLLGVLLTLACDGTGEGTEKPSRGPRGDAAVEGEGEPGEGEGEQAAEGEGDGSAEGEGEGAPTEGEGEGEGAPVDDPNCPCDHGPCVEREREVGGPICAPPCGAGDSCPQGNICLTFPGGKRCLPSGEQAHDRNCISPAQCIGGLCVHSGGAFPLCTGECSGRADEACGPGRSCLPSMKPAGAFHCFKTSILPTGNDCLNEEHRCQGGHCKGAGQASYCTEWCDPAAGTCPEGWECAAERDGHICCNPRNHPNGCGGAG